MALADQQHMATAIRIAEHGRYSTHPNPCVGCVLVKGEAIVGKGFHLIAGQGHAEANALSDAGDKANGATAYVTLEPCSFRGRTPSCAQALIDAGIKKVVVAMLDPHARNAGKGITMLQDAGIEVVTPFMAEAASQLVRGHVLRHTQQRPFVRLKLAMTLDGKTALASGESQWITSPEARRDVQRLRAMSSAIVTGVQTVIDDDPRLSVRDGELDVEHGALAASVKRPVYILDSTLRVLQSAQLLQDPSSVLATVSDKEIDIPAEVLRLPAEVGRVSISALLKELAFREHSEVLFECGSTLAGSLIDQRLVDEIILYVAPKFIGHSGMSLLNLKEVDRMADLAELDIIDVRTIGPDLKIVAGIN